MQALVENVCVANHAVINVLISENLHVEARRKSPPLMYVCFPLYQIEIFFPVYNILIHSISTIICLKYS